MPPSNPSSVHYYGQRAKSRLIKGRTDIAMHLNVRADEIIFTAGGTESMNMMILGFSAKHPLGHIITSNIEHSCTEAPLKHLAKRGWDITFLQAEESGAISLEELTCAIRPSTKAIIIGAANSETGVKNNIEEIAKLARKHGLAFFIDAVGIFGKDPFSIPQGATGVAFSGHKFHAPKGTGFCYLQTPYSIDPIFFGGGQEFTMRSGTENLPGIVGLSKAVEIVATSAAKTEQQIRSLRDYFERELQSSLTDIIINGTGPRVSNVSNISFTGVDGETLLIQLDMNSVMASHGSACSSGSLEPSKVLLGMGFSKERARSSIRFSLSRYTTKEEIDKALSIITQSVKALRG
jgi:cysteine desulfurase